jgi:tryptophan synthase alpha chain
MSRITDKFKELKKQNRAALIPYIMAGDPDMATTERLVVEIEKAGADMLELGVPFSDPLADGPTIQKAAMKALASGADIKGVLGLVKRMRARSDMPVILMLYYNLVFKYGEERFVKDSVKAGVDGVIIPDLPPDEAGSLMTHAKAHGLDVVFLLAPTSDETRVRLVSRCSGGFIYYVSLTGVTGARKSLNKDLQAQVGKVKRSTNMPVCVGFGISGPQQAKSVGAWADGVIVGSAIVSLIDKAKAPGSACREVARFVRSLRDAVANSR